MTPNVSAIPAPVQPLWLLFLLLTTAHALPSLQPCSPPYINAAIKHLSDFIQFRTISDAAAPDHVQEADQFQQMDQWMRGTYSDVWEALEVEKVGTGGMSYLLTWRGSKPGLKPVLFVSHTDVVPVEEKTPEEWQHPPFSGAVADGYIWGRGALDVKVTVVTLLEAATALLQQGYKPQRTLLFAFGQDEEVGGTHGAAQIAALLTERGAQLEVIVDEGIGVAMDGFAPFTRQPVAVVGTAEKQMQTVKIRLQSRGGHSAKPPIDGSSIGGKMGRLMTAVSSNPPAAKLVSPTKEFVIGLADIAPAWLYPVLVLVKRFSPAKALLAKAMALASDEAATLVRTTTVVTRASAGVADNVLPQTGSVTIDFRLLPNDTPQTALQHARAWLGRDVASANVTLGRPMQQHHQMPVADASGPHFAMMRAAIQQAWRLGEQGSQPVHVLPFLMPAMTDSRHYAHLSPNGALRWTPTKFSKAGGELSTIHGVNERIPLSDYACGLKTYQSLLQQFGDYVGSKGQQQQQHTAKVQQSGTQLKRDEEL